MFNWKMRINYTKENDECEQAAVEIKKRKSRVKGHSIQFNISDAVFFSLTKWLFWCVFNAWTISSVVRAAVLRLIPIAVCKSCNLTRAVFNSRRKSFISLINVTFSFIY